MLPLLSEGLRLAQYLLRPEDSAQMTTRSGSETALAGLAKTLLWACLAVLAGLGLGQLHG